MTDDIRLHSTKEFFKSTDGYQIFFGVLVIFGFLAPFFGLVAIILIHDPHGPQSWFGKVIMVLLSILGALTIILNLGEPKTSAKELFWAWIIFFSGIAIFTLNWYWRNIAI